MQVCPGFIETELTLGAGIGKDGKPFGKYVVGSQAGRRRVNKSTTARIADAQPSSYYCYYCLLIASCSVLSEQFIML